MAYLYPEGIPLAHYSRGTTRVDEVVIHESVTRTRQATVAVLKARKLGVHLIIDRDGSVTQHAPFTAACAHAEGFNVPSLHNERSIAVEIVNRYYGGKAIEGEDTIPAMWAHKGSYILPTPVQLESLWSVLCALEQRLVMPLTIPGWQRDWLGRRRFVWGRIKRHEIPGVMAHARWDHSDGLFPEHYALMRSLGWSSAEAYQLTINAASSGSRKTVVQEPPHART